MCAAVSSYVHACSAAGVHISGWRDTICGESEGGQGPKLLGDRTSHQSPQTPPPPLLLSEPLTPPSVP